MNIATELDIKISRHDLPVVTHALVQRRKAIMAELSVLEIAKERELSKEERWMLPVNLQVFDREQLMEQINPWKSLLMTVESLIETFRDADAQRG